MRLLDPRQMASASKVGPRTVSCHLLSPPLVHERFSRLRDQLQTVTRTTVINASPAGRIVSALGMLLRLDRRHLKITTPPNVNAMHASEMDESALKKPRVDLQATNLYIHASRLPGPRYRPNAPATTTTSTQLRTHTLPLLRRGQRQI